MISEVYLKAISLLLGYAYLAGILFIGIKDIRKYAPTLKRRAPSKRARNLRKSRHP